MAQLVRVDAGYACSSGDGYEAETGHHLDVDLWDVLFGARALQWGRAWCPRSPSLAYPSPPSTSPVPPPPSWTRRYADDDESEVTPSSWSRCCASPMPQDWGKEDD